ncbi:transcription initiation factor TFIID subunit 8 isoform X1 [Myiozetetes cayanensis]|nr:transcription initiation factor TFIID subunit 8 isoform X1 [Myiozetetes cayanensis]
MCVCMCVYMCVYMCVCMCVRVCTYVCACVYVCTCVYICVCRCVHVCTGVYMCVHVCAFLPLSPSAPPSPHSLGLPGQYLLPDPSQHLFPAPSHYLLLTLPITVPKSFPLPTSGSVPIPAPRPFPFPFPAPAPCPFPFPTPAPSQPLLFPVPIPHPCPFPVPGPCPEAVPAVQRPGSKQAGTPADNYHLARRRTLQVVVSSLLTEAGFESAEKAAVETLTEMIQSYISEIGRSAKSYCEHTARTQPTLSDIVVTLVEMGFNVETLPAYAKRSQRMVITAPPVTNQPVTPKALTAGQNKPHPSHIPGHFPEFPDPHTYIKTPTYREPVSDYQVLREKAASQRRDVERALTRFMAKTGETQSLFKDDVSTFPLIAARPFTVPYLTALLPSELEMQQMEETDSSEQDEQTDTENLPLHMSTDDSGPEKENASVLQQNTSLAGSRNGEENVIDNPYLRPVKKPKIRRKK